MFNASFGELKKKLLVVGSDTHYIQCSTHAITEINMTKNELLSHTFSSYNALYNKCHEKDEHTHKKYADINKKMHWSILAYT